MQTEFIITFDETLGKLSCDIEGTIHMSPYLDDLLDEIANYYGYMYQDFYTTEDKKIVLEQELEITIVYDFDL